MDEIAQSENVINVIRNVMTVRMIWDISPLLFFINFEITLADAMGDF